MYLALVKETSSISPLPGSFPPCLYQHESSATSFLSVCHRTGTFYYCSRWVFSLELPEKRRPGQGRRGKIGIKTNQEEVRIQFRNPNIALWSLLSRWNIYIPSKQVILEFRQKLCQQSTRLKFPRLSHSLPQFHPDQGTAIPYCKTPVQLTVQSKSW